MKNDSNSSSVDFSKDVSFRGIFFGYDGGPNDIECKVQQKIWFRFLETKSLFKEEKR